jgi:hypothetical protein
MGFWWHPATIAIGSALAGTAAGGADVLAADALNGPIKAAREVSDGR